MDMVKFVIFGAIVGVANIIPGVSGGTMAVILKIYDRLIETLSLKNVKKNLPFISAGHRRGRGDRLVQQGHRVLARELSHGHQFYLYGADSRQYSDDFPAGQGRENGGQGNGFLPGGAGGHGGHRAAQAR